MSADHVARARELLEHPNLGAEATAHAVLALVEQQRIANLIALANSTGDLVSIGKRALLEHDRSNGYGPTPMPALHPEIRKGLGL